MLEDRSITACDQEHLCVRLREATSWGMRWHRSMQCVMECTLELGGHAYCCSGTRTHSTICRAVASDDRIVAAISPRAKRRALLPLFLTLTLQSCEEATPARGPTFEQVVTLLDDAAEELHTGIFMDSSGNQQVWARRQAHLFVCLCWSRHLD